MIKVTVTESQNQEKEKAGSRINDIIQHAYSMLTL